VTSAADPAMVVPLTVADLPGGPVQPLPVVTPLNEHFWRGGAAGELRVLRCDDCGKYVHPPRPACPCCLSRSLTARAVSGEASVYSVTVNHHPWYPGQQVPYAVALVELPEQPGLRLTTNIVGCPPEKVQIGMQVRAVFVPAEDVWVPVFAVAVPS
jgi:uncharacterized protein